MRPVPKAGEDWIQFRPSDPERMLHEYTRAFEALGKKPGVEVERSSVRGMPYLTLRLPATGPNPKRVLITAAAHGDERAGVPASLEILQWMLKSPELRENVDLTVIPIMNPTGYARNTRNNDQGINLNRQHFDGSPHVEVSGVQKTLAHGGFDLVLDLHGSEDMKGGFFLIGNEVDGKQGKLPPDVAALAGDVMVDLASHPRFPVADRGTDVYHRAQKGLFTTENESVMNKYFGDRGTANAFTVEAPHNIPYRDRIDGLVYLTKGFIERVTRAASASPRTPSGPSGFDATDSFDSASV